MTIKISLAQSAIHLGKIEKNFMNGQKLMEKAASEGSDVIVFPELWTTGFDYGNLEILAQENEGIINELLIFAQKNHLAIAGSYILNHNGKYWNELIFIEPDGKIHSYQKIHLFKLINEQLHFRSGNLPVIFDFKGFRIGLSICYDLRFPEFYRFYAVNSADLVLVVAEWPRKRIDHWRTLSKARAIDNQFFLACSNAMGETAGSFYGGYSSLIDPWGKVVCQLQTQMDSLITGVMDLDTISKTRQKLPVFKDHIL